MIIRQSGVIETEVERIFTVEVPEVMTAEQAYDLLESVKNALPDEGMAWTDSSEKTWVGHEVEAQETEVFDLGHFPKIEELAVIRLSEGA